MGLPVLTHDPSVNWSSPQQRSFADKPVPPIVRKGFRPTRWGWFPWCPQPLPEIVHPFDVGLAERLIPGPRILTVNPCHSDPEYQLISYGHLSFRMMPILWREVSFEGYCLGDLVEISKLYSKSEAALATIEEISWDNDVESIVYHLSRRGRLCPEKFSRHQFNLVTRIDQARVPISHKIS